jgi:hypothetical protein
MKNLESIIQNKIQDFKYTFFLNKINYKPTCEVCEKSAFLGLCLAKGADGV